MKSVLPLSDIVSPFAGKERFERGLRFRRTQALAEDLAFLRRCAPRALAESPRISARAAATAPGGSAAISRAALSACGIDVLRFDHQVGDAVILGRVASSGWPMTRTRTRGAGPSARGTSRVDAGFRYQPEADERSRKRASVAATTKSQCSSMVVPMPTATPLTAATSGLRQWTSAGRKRSACAIKPLSPVGGGKEIREIVAGGERPRHAGDQHAAHRVACARAFERSGHRLVHGERERVLLLRPVSSGWCGCRPHR